MAESPVLSGVAYLTTGLCIVWPGNGRIPSFKPTRFASQLIQVLAMSALGRRGPLRR